MTLNNVSWNRHKMREGTNCRDLNNYIYLVPWVRRVADELIKSTNEKDREVGSYLIEKLKILERQTFSRWWNLADPLDELTTGERKIAALKIFRDMPIETVCRVAGVNGGSATQLASRFQKKYVIPEQDFYDAGDPTNPRCKNEPPISLEQFLFMQKGESWEKAWRKYQKNSNLPNMDHVDENGNPGPNKPAYNLQSFYAVEDAVGDAFVNKVLAAHEREEENFERHVEEYDEIHDENHDWRIHAFGEKEVLDPEAERNWV